MIANVSAHRRANAFAQALEEQSTQSTAPEQPEEPSDQSEHTRMLAMASSLAEAPRPKLDPEVKTVQRARLVAAMEAMTRDGTAPGEAADRTVPEQKPPPGRSSHRAGPLHGLKPRSRLSKSLAAGGLTVGVAAGALGGVAAASSDALPGDSLYGLKRGMEDVKLGMAASDSDRGEIYLDQASTRLNEARRLMERGRSGPLDHESVGEVRHALSGMRHDATEGRRLLFSAYERDGSLAAIQVLSSFSQTHRDTWTALRDRLPLQLDDMRDEVTSVFDAIDQEVDPLRPLLPYAPAHQPGSTAPHSVPGSERPSDTDDTSPSRSEDPSSSGKDHSTSPTPSGSGTDGQGGGLLGSAPGHLLDPPSATTPPTSPPAETDQDDPPAEPDITLPPLLPGFLPDFGLDDQDDDQT